MSTEIQVCVNGESLRFPDGASVAGLLERLEVANPRVAVERNREIVPRAAYASTRLLEGDELEVVELVGGG